MTTTPPDLTLFQTMLNEAIRDELNQRGLSRHILRDFCVELNKEDGQLRLSFPSNVMTLKLSDADERAFLNVFNSWAEKLANLPGSTFKVTTDAVAGTKSLHTIACTAFSPLDLIRGVNETLKPNHQIDASLFGRSK